MVNERQKRDSNFMYLMIEFQHIHFEDNEYTIVYFEKVMLWTQYSTLIFKTAFIS